MRTLAYLTTLAIALACTGWAPSAEAHDLPIERSLVVQVHSSHAELLLVYREPPGPRTQRLLALYDADENGEIDGAEGALAKRPMLRRAFLGLNLEFADVKTGKKEPQIRYKRERGGGLSVAIYQRIDFVNPTNELQFSTQLEETRGVPELKLVVELAGRWSFSDSDSDEVKAKLGPGGRKEITLERKPTPANRAEPDRDWQPPDRIRP